MLAVLNMNLSKMKKSLDPMPLPPGGSLQAVQQQRQLLRAQALAAALAHRSGKATALEPFCVKNQSRPIPKKNFQPIARAVEKDELKTGNGILHQGFFDRGRQAIKTLAAINGREGQKDPRRRR